MNYSTSFLTKLALPALGIAAAVVASPSGANAAACVVAPVATYTASGFSCSVNTDSGPVTFSDITVTPTVTGSGSVALGDFIPETFVVSGVTEYGLALTYTSSTGTTPNSQADIAWVYDVSGTPDLVDAYVSLSGNTTGTGTIAISEVLSNGVTLSLNGAGVDSTTFDPVSDLNVIKDQNDFSGSDGSATSSVMVNAFSVAGTPVPEPASIGIMGAALVAMGIRKRRRSRKNQG